MPNQLEKPQNNKLWAWIKQHKLLLVIIILFLLLNNISYIMGFWRASQGTNLVYTASPYTNRADHFVYLSHVEQGKDGYIFTKLLYNHLAENNVLFSPHWYAIGQFSKFTGISSPASYFMFRIVFLIAFLFILWWFIKKIFSDYKKALIAMLVILFGNGLGTIFINIFADSPLIPTNLWMPESITFLTLNQTPLFVLALILILLTFSFFIEGVKKNKLSLVWLACASNLLLTLIHTYDLIITASVLAGWSAFKLYQTKNKKIILYLALVGTTSGVGALYYVWLLRRDLAMIQWNLQNICTSGPFAEYLWGMGLLFVFSVAGVIYIIKNKKFKNDYLNLITIWAVLGWVMVYLPVHFNRRLSNGWHMALVITSLIFFFWLYKKTPLLLKSLLLTVVGFLVFFDTINFLILDSSVIYSDEDHYFIQSQEKHSAYKHIKDTTDDHDVIMSRALDGNQVPGFTGRKVYTGHIMGTWEAILKDREVERLWSNPNDLSVWLEKNNIAYIFASKIYIPEFDKIKWLAREPYIEPVVDNDELILYKVLLEE